jgi:hypothetical protein
MEVYLSTSFIIVCVAGLFTLGCCILSLMDHSKRGQVLFRL